MAYYLWTGNYSSEAIQAMIKNPQDREAAGRKAIEAAGGKMHHMFMSLGSSDVVVLCEFPGDLNVVAVSLAVGAAGAISNAATTKLMTMSEFSQAMKLAGEIAGSYTPPQA